MAPPSAEPPKGPFIRMTALGHTEETIRQLHALRLAGLHRDASSIPALLAVLQAPRDGYLLYAALHALGQIGNEEVLPAIETLLVSASIVPDVPDPFSAASTVQAWGSMHAGGKPPEIPPSADEHSIHKEINVLDGIPNCNHMESRGQAQAVIARLKANRKIKTLRSSGPNATEWLDEFLIVLRRTPAELNAAVAANVGVRSPFSSWAAVALEIYALRELADQIYLLRDAELFYAAKSAGIDFATDPGARLKIEFALLSKEERLRVIVARLASLRTLSGDYIYLTQLAANEGPLAGHMAAAKLKEMDERHEIYVWSEGPRQSSPGYGAMFHLLSAVGDSAHEPVVAAYLAGPPGDIHHYADQVYPEVSKGLAWGRVTGY